MFFCNVSCFWHICSTVHGLIALDPHFHQCSRFNFTSAGLILQTWGCSLNYHEPRSTDLRIPLPQWKVGCCHLFRCLMVAWRTMQTHLMHLLMKNWDMTVGCEQNALAALLENQMNVDLVMKLTAPLIVIMVLFSSCVLFGCLWN